MAQAEPHRSVVVSETETMGNEPLRGKRIFIVLSSLELGGAERQALLLGRGLARDYGAKIEVRALGRVGAAADLCRAYKLSWGAIALEPGRRRLPVVSGLGMMSRFARVLRSERPDIILPYSATNTLCGLTWRWTGAQVCVWSQRTGGFDRQRYDRLAARLTPWYVSNSRHGAEFLIHTLGANPGRVRVIPNGVELAKPQFDRVSWRSRLGTGPDTFVSCMVANLHRAKDHATLLKAWRQVVDELRGKQDAVLALAGRHDDAYPALKELTGELGLDEHVRFLGPVGDVSGLLQAVDLGLHTSPFANYEGIPNGVLEAMASGLPVLGSDVPGVCEALGPEQSQHLTPIGDSAALARQIVAWAHAPDLRRNLGEANRRRIEAEFSPARLCARTADLLSRALHPARGCYP